MFKLLLMILIFTLPALARTPDEVVRRIFDTHLKVQDQRKTVAANQDCFTPGFLGILERAFKGQPPKPFVDCDIFSDTQMGLLDFEVGATKITGKEAVVALTVWGGRGKVGQRQNGTPRKAVVYLTDIGDGDGFQVRDLEHLPSKDSPRSFRVREWLVPIAEGRWK